MSDNTLKEKLINKIREIDDPAILEEVSNLFELQEPGTEYQLSEKQKKVINEAMEQIDKGQTLTDEDANKEADKWENE